MNPLIGITHIKSYQSFNVILIINTKFNEARDVIDVSTYIFVNNNEQSARGSQCNCEYRCIKLPCNKSVL